MSITLQTVSSGYNLSTINANFQSLQNALNNNILWRTGSVAGEAKMSRDLDMDGNNLLNIGTDLSLPGSLITVGQADARYVSVSGDSLEGTLDANGNKITGLPASSAPSDAIRKSELDAEASYRASADASLQSQISGATPVLIEERPVVQYHSNTLSNSFVIPAEMNAFSIGPQITINPGQTVTLGTNSYWNILGNVFEADELYNVTANNLKTSDNAHSVAVADIDSVITGPGTVAVTGGSITGITDLAIADGGTGASDAATARTNLGLGSLATQSSASVTITGGSITGITDLAVADGGTGSSTAAGARTNLGAAASGANTDITSLQGHTAGTAAAAGKVGEVLTATGTATAYTTATQVNLTSISLTAGDWEVDAVALFDSTGATLATAITGLNTTSATIGAFPDRTSIGGNTYDINLRTRRRYLVSATTTVYLVGYAEFTGGTVQVNGYIEARRMR